MAGVCLAAVDGHTPTGEFRAFTARRATGGREAALITYYGFLSIFPLLLLGVAVLSQVLASHPDLRERLIAAVVPAGAAVHG